MKTKRVLRQTNTIHVGDRLTTRHIYFHTKHNTRPLQRSYYSAKMVSTKLRTACNVHCRSKNMVGNQAQWQVAQLYLWQSSLFSDNVIANSHF